MPKIFKSPFIFQEDSSVDISNEIVIPVELSGEISLKLLEEERLRKEEEERIAAEEEAAAVEARIVAEVDARVAEMREVLEAQQRNVMFKANSVAETIVASAHNDANGILAKANVKIHDLKEEAKVQGHKEGFEAGHAAAIAELKPSLDQAKALLEEINRRKDAYYAAHEDRLLNTVIEMVEKILAKELETDKAALLSIAAQAAKGFRNSAYLKVSVAKGELGFTMQSDPELVRAIAPTVPDIELELLADADGGTLILDDGHNIVDASLPTQLEFLKEILSGAREQAEEQQGE